jgi:hypothetical protein
MRHWILVVSIVVIISIGVVVFLNKYRHPSPVLPEEPSLELPNNVSKTRPSLVPLPSHSWLPDRVDASPIDVETRLSFSTLWNRLSEVKKEYDYWLDAGYSHEQVQIRLFPNGTLETRVSTDDIDRPPIEPGVLTAFDLYDQNPAASIAVGQITDEATDITGHCLNAFLQRLRQQEIKLTEGLNWRYVWHIQSNNGISRVIDIDVKEEWWPLLFDDKDRACYNNAFKIIKDRQFITDAPDFDYSVETGLVITKDE